MPRWRQDSCYSRLRGCFLFLRATRPRSTPGGTARKEDGGVCACVWTVDSMPHPCQQCGECLGRPSFLSGRGTVVGCVEKKEGLAEDLHFRPLRPATRHPAFRADYHGGHFATAEAERRLSFKSKTEVSSFNGYELTMSGLILSVLLLHPSKI